jgi:hypothetical protein
MKDDRMPSISASRLNRASEGFSEGRAAPESPRARILTTLHPAVAVELH